MCGFRRFFIVILYVLLCTSARAQLTINVASMIVVDGLYQPSCSSVAHGVTLENIGDNVKVLIDGCTIAINASASATKSAVTLRTGLGVNASLELRGCDISAAYDVPATSVTYSARRGTVRLTSRTTFGAGSSLVINGSSVAMEEQGTGDYGSAVLFDYNLTLGAGFAFKVINRSNITLRALAAISCDAILVMGDVNAPDDPRTTFEPGSQFLIEDSNVNATVKSSAYTISFVLRVTFRDHTSISILRSNITAVTTGGSGARNIRMSSNIVLEKYVSFSIVKSQVIATSATRFAFNFQTAGTTWSENGAIVVEDSTLGTTATAGRSAVCMQLTGSYGRDFSVGIRRSGLTAKANSTTIEPTSAVALYATFSPNSTLAVEWSRLETDAPHDNAPLLFSGDIKDLAIKLLASTLQFRSSVETSQTPSGAIVARAGTWSNVSLTVVLSRLTGLTTASLSTLHFVAWPKTIEGLSPQSFDDVNMTATSAVKPFTVASDGTGPGPNTTLCLRNVRDNGEVVSDGPAAFTVPDNCWPTGTATLSRPPSPTESQSPAQSATRSKVKRHSPSASATRTGSMSKTSTMTAPTLSAQPTNTTSPTQLLTITVSKSQTVLQRQTATASVSGTKSRAWTQSVATLSASRSITQTSTATHPLTLTLTRIVPPTASHLLTSTMSQPSTRTTAISITANTTTITDSSSFETPSASTHPSVSTSQTETRNTASLSPGSRSVTVEVSRTATPSVTGRWSLSDTAATMSASHAASSTASVLPTHTSTETESSTATASLSGSVSETGRTSTVSSARTVTEPPPATRSLTASPSGSVTLRLTTTRSVSITTAATMSHAVTVTFSSTATAEMVPTASGATTLSSTQTQTISKEIPRPPAVPAVTLPPAVEAVVATASTAGGTAAAFVGTGVTGATQAGRTLAVLQLVACSGGDGEGSDGENGSPKDASSVDSEGKAAPFPQALLPWLKVGSGQVGWDRGVVIGNAFAVAAAVLVGTALWAAVTRVVEFVAARKGPECWAARLGTAPDANAPAAANTADVRMSRLMHFPGAAVSVPLGFAIDGFVGEAVALIRHGVEGRDGAGIGDVALGGSAVLVGVVLWAISIYVVVVVVARNVGTGPLVSAHHGGQATQTSRRSFIFRWVRFLRDGDITWSVTAVPPVPAPPPASPRSHALQHPQQGASQTVADRGSQERSDTASSGAATNHDEVMERRRERYVETVARHRFAARWAVLFAPLRPTARLFPALDIAASVAVAVARGLRPRTSDGCQRALVAVASVQVLLLAAVLVMRPFIAPLKTLVAAAAAGLLALSAVAATVAVFAKAGGRAYSEGATDFGVAAGYLALAAGVALLANPLMTVWRIVDAKVAARAAARSGEATEAAKFELQFADFLGEAALPLMEEPPLADPLDIVGVDEWAEGPRGGLDFAFEMESFGGRSETGGKGEGSGSDLFDLPPALGSGGGCGVGLEAEMGSFALDAVLPLQQDRPIIQTDDGVDADLGLDLRMATPGPIDGPLFEEPSQGFPLEAFLDTSHGEITTHVTPLPPVGDDDALVFSLSAAALEHHDTKGPEDLVEVVEDEEPDGVDTAGRRAHNSKRRGSCDSYDDGDVDEAHRRVFKKGEVVQAKGGEAAVLAAELEAMLSRPGKDDAHDHGIAASQGAAIQQQEPADLTSLVDGPERPQREAPRRDDHSQEEESEKV